MKRLTFPRLIHAGTRLCGAMLLLAFGASKALGHGGGDSMGDWDKGDACNTQRGHYTVHMTAYQEKYGASELAMLYEVGSAKVRQEFQAYCDGVPQTGKLSMAFDLYNAEMRKLPVSVRIVEAGDGSGGNTILSLPSTVYPDGTVRVDAEIPNAGRYIAIMKLEKVGPGIAHKPHRAADPGEWHLVSHSHGNDPTEAEMHAIDPTFRFPFTVGLKRQRQLPWIFSNLGFQAAGTLIGVAALVVGVRFYMNGKRKKQA